jgi:hypothetical protein
MDFIVLSLFSMAVSAESAAGDSTHVARLGVGIGMAGKARRAGVRMPISVVVVRHESAWMRLRIGPFHSIGIDVALHADRIVSFRIMTTHATLDIPARLFCVLTASGPDSKRHKAGEFMARRDGSTKSLASTRVAIAAERLGLVTHLAIRRPSSRIDAVRETIVKIMYHLPLQRLRFVVTEDAR